MVELYPPTEPYSRGMLDVGEGNAIYWELRGSRHGKPAVVLHGGPGQGSSPNMARGFDPERYRIVLFDQRGCGRSLPHASAPETDMAVNTTHHLIADMEKLRAHLGIEKWLLVGGSWGSTLALAYALEHPSRVSEIVLNTVTTSRRVEAEWLYEGLGRFFPEAWERFRDHIPIGEREGGLIAAYSRRMDHPDLAIRSAAARSWCAWEDAALSLEPHAAASSYSDLSPESLLAFVRICTHYLHHGAWLEEGALIRDAKRLAGIPGVLIHGRRDLTCPIDTAWELARAWPGASLVDVADAGHFGSDSKRTALLRTLDSFASRKTE